MEKAAKRRKLQTDNLQWGLSEEGGGWYKEQPAERGGHSEAQQEQLAATTVIDNSPPDTDKNPEELVTGVKQGEERNKKAASKKVQSLGQVEKIATRSSKITNYFSMSTNRCQEEEVSGKPEDTVTDEQFQLMLQYKLDWQVDMGVNEDSVDRWEQDGCSELTVASPNR